MKTSLALCVGFLSSIAIYALLRTLGAFMGHEPNPATLVYSIHAAFFWRAWTSAYGGALLAVIASLFDAPRLLAIVEKSLVPIALLALVQALFIP